MDSLNWQGRGTRGRAKGLERRLWGTLLAGFGLMLLLMIASGWMSMVAMRRMGQGTQQLGRQYAGQSQLMDRLVRRQADVGVLLFSMAKEAGGARMADYSGEIASQRAGLIQLVNDALGQEQNPAERRALISLGDSAKQLFTEMERLVTQQRNNSPELSTLHRQFIAGLADLMDTSFAGASAQQTAEVARDQETLASARSLLVASLALAIICAACCVLGALLLFHRLERRAEALEKLSIFNLAEQEEAARRFSREMHDEFGQTLNAIESSLAVISAKDEDSRARVKDALALSKEAQNMAREMSQLLRPRILDDLGLDAGLRELAAGYSKRTGITVDYTSNLRQRLLPDVETHLFRIAQEALTNVSRHTIAHAVELSLIRADGELRLLIADDGGGFPNDRAQSTGLGMIGMTERARAIGGTVSVNSVTGKGVEIQVRLAQPAQSVQPEGERAAQTSSPSQPVRHDA